MINESHHPFHSIFGGKGRSDEVDQPANHKSERGGQWTCVVSPSKSGWTDKRSSVRVVRVVPSYLFLAQLRHPNAGTCHPYRCNGGGGHTR